MARGKVQLKRIENPVHRQVTFCKRRAGLLKKAKELSVLCDADVGIIVFSGKGKLYELTTKGNMLGLIERYMDITGTSGTDTSAVNKTQDPEKEIVMLKQEIEVLQKGLRYMLGGDTTAMTLDQLQALERNLELWIYTIRSSKMQIMLEEIQILKNKEDILKAANEILQEKIAEQNIVQIVDQTGAFNRSPVIADINYPLTIQDEFFSNFWRL